MLAHSIYTQFDIDQSDLDDFTALYSFYFSYQDLDWIKARFSDNESLENFMSRFVLDYLLQIALVYDLKIHKLILLSSFQSIFFSYLKLMVYVYFDAKLMDSFSNALKHYENLFTRFNERSFITFTSGITVFRAYSNF